MFRSFWNANVSEEGKHSFMWNYLFALLSVLHILQFTVGSLYWGEYRKNKDFGFEEKEGAVEGTQGGKKDEERSQKNKLPPSISLLNQPALCQIKPACFLNCLLACHVVQSKYFRVMFTNGTVLFSQECLTNNQPKIKPCPACHSNLIYY